MAICEACGAGRRGAVGGFGRIAQRKVERGRFGQAGRDHLGQRVAPAGAHGIGQRRRGGQRGFALHQRGEHAMRQPPRAAGKQRQAGRDHRVRRGLEPQPLRQHQPQHRARLGVVGDTLARRAVDQRVEIGEPAQRLVDDRERQCTVGGAVDTAQRSALGLFERLAAPQHRVQQFERRAAGGKSGGFGHCGAA